MLSYVPANQEPIITDAGTGGQRQRDVARIADAAVGPDRGADLAGGLGALQHRAELRPADPGHHPGGAHGAGSDADLDHVGAGLDQIPYAVGRDHVAGDQRDPAAGPVGLPVADVADRLQGLQHLLLVPVRGVDDEDVDPGRQQRLGPPGDIAVDPDRGAEDQPARRVDARAGRGWSAGRACGSSRRPAARRPRPGRPRGGWR